MPLEKASLPVAIQTGTQKFALLDGVLVKSGFWEYLQAVFKKSFKLQEEFLIVIKPDFMWFTSSKNAASCTDTELVVYLLQKLYTAGYHNLWVVESENDLSSWYLNRSVEAVGRLAGYREEFYKLENITTKSLPYTFTGVLKHHLVGKAWQAADFRISFAKNKTHILGGASLSLMNIYGVLPRRQKVLYYEQYLSWPKVIIDMCNSFKIHFGIIDAFTSSDGPLGFRGTKIAKATETLMASRDCLALDVVALEKIGLAAARDPLLTLASATWGKPVYSVEYNGVLQVEPLAPYGDWVKVAPWFLKLWGLLKNFSGFKSWLIYSTLLVVDPIFTECRFRGYRILRGFWLRVKRS